MTPKKIEELVYNPGGWHTAAVRSLKSFLSGLRMSIAQPLAALTIGLLFLLGGCGRSELFPDDVIGCIPGTPGCGPVIVDAGVDAQDAGQDVDATDASDAGDPDVIDAGPPILISITVSPVDPFTPIGTQIGFTATAHFSDGSTANYTSLVVWTTDNSNVATIATTGLASGLTKGATSVTATYTSTNGVVYTGTTLLTVTPPLVSIVIVQDVQIDLDELTVSAIGFFSDGSEADITTSVTWASSNPNVVRISPATGALSGQELLFGAEAGTATITATLGSIVGTFPVRVFTNGN